MREYSFQSVPLVLQKVMKTKALGFDYLLTKFVPGLRKLGVKDDKIRLLLEENPQRVLTFDNAAEKKITGWNFDWDNLFHPC